MSNNPNDNKPKPKPVSSGSRKVFDVMRPGKAPASPTSRPVIASHKPQVQETVGGVGDSRQTPSPKQKISITPEVHDEVAQSSMAQEVKVVTTVPPLPKTAIEPKQPEPTVAPEPPVEALPKLEAPTVEPPTPEVSVATEVTPEPTKQPDAFEMAPAIVSAPSSIPVLPLLPEGDQDPLLDTAAPQLESNQVVVSHHRKPGRALKVILAIVIILVVAVLAFDILLDAGVINIPAVPRTHFLL